METQHEMLLWIDEIKKHTKKLIGRVLVLSKKVRFLNFSTSNEEGGVPNTV